MKEQANLAKKILAEAEQGRSQPLYYLYGDEPFKTNEFCRKFQEVFLRSEKTADLSFSMDRLDGSQCSVEDIMDAAATTGFLFGGAGESSSRGEASSKRLVLVRQAHLLKRSERLIAWCQGQTADQERPNAVLLVADALDGRKKFHQWVKQNGCAIEFRKAMDRELLQWAHYLAKKRGVSLEAAALDALAVLCDGSLHRLDQEIEKACLYKGAPTDGAVLTADDVAAVATHDVSPQMADLVSAVFEGKRVRALLTVSKVIQSADDAIGFVGFCVWALKNPTRFRSAAPDRFPNRGRVLDELLGLDRKLKSSGQEAQSLVNEFVVRLCGPLEPRSSSGRVETGIEG